MQKERTRAVLLLFATAFFWSLAGLLIKSIPLPALSVAGWRSAIAFFVILGFAGFRAIRFSWPQVLGSICYASTVTFFVCANKMTTSANAIILQYTAPLYVILLSGTLLKERIYWYDIAAVAGTLVGTSLFFFDKLSPGGLWGNILAILSGITFALVILFLRMQKEGSPAGSVVLGNLLTALMCLPWMIRFTPDWPTLPPLIILGVFQLGMSYVCYTVAIKRVTAMEGTLIPMLEPILNPLWVLLFLGERPSAFALIGGGIILFSILTRTWLSLKYQAKNVLTPLN